MALIVDTKHSDFIHVIGDGRIGPGLHDIEEATNDDDQIHIANGGHDALFSGGGNDTVFAQDKFDALEQIDGEAGTDTLGLMGNYKRPVVFNATTLINVEHLSLVGGYTYNLVFAEETIAPLSQNPGGMAIYGGGATQQLRIDASADTDGYLDVYASDGNDVIVGSSWQNNFHMAGTGHDSVTGGSQGDLFGFTSYDRHDHIDGGGGYDVLSVGALSTDLDLDENALVNVEEIDLLGANDFRLTITDGVMASGSFLKVSSGESSSNHLVLDASNDTDSWLQVTGGAGDDLIRGSQFKNTFTMSGGNDGVYGGAGNDTFSFGATFNSLDRAYGGGGDDVLSVSSSVNPTSFTLSHAMIRNIDTFRMSGNVDFHIQTLDNLLAAGETITVDTFSTHPLTFDGSLETNGSFYVKGSSAADILTGGKGGDILQGNGGKDTLTPGAGNDHVAYSSWGDSTGVNYDTVVGFDFDATDQFDVLTAPTVIDRKVAHGTLSTATFDADLAAAVSASKMAVGHAVLFTPDAGTLAGHVFLLINANPFAGYQTNADYVIELSSAHHIGALDTADFI